MTACLVEEDAAELIANHHRHRTRRRRSCVEQHDRPLGGRPGEGGGRSLIEKFKAALKAGRLHGGLDLAVALGHGMHHQSHSSPSVLVMHALRIGDQDLLGAIAVRDGDLPDRARNIAGRLVCLEQQLDLRLGIDGFRRHLDRLRGMGGARDLAQGESPATSLTHRRGQLGGLQQTVRGEVFGIDVTHHAAVDDAQPGAPIVARADPLDLALLDTDRLVAFSLYVELGEVRAGCEGALDHAVYEGLVNERHSGKV